MRNLRRWFINKDYVVKRGYEIRSTKKGKVSDYMKVSLGLHKRYHHEKIK